MTEAQWLSSHDPHDILLIDRGDLKHTDRQLRNFVEHCRFVAQPRRPMPWGYDLEDHKNVISAAIEWAYNAKDDGHAMMSRRANLLRELIGNPFRPILWNCTHCGTERIPGGWNACPELKCGRRCNWRSRDVMNIATLLGSVEGFQPLDSQMLRELHDALVDAGGQRRGCLTCSIAVARGGPNPDPSAAPCGCVETDILAHLLSPGPHLRGCWVIDLILGRD